MSKKIDPVEVSGNQLKLVLDIRGTAFQRRVWQALREIPRYEVHLDRKFERMLTMLLRLKELRPATVES